MSGDCAAGDHGACPDTVKDTGTCSCPCHLAQMVTDERFGASIIESIFEGV